ncbi:MAG: TRAP transporter small permease subunit [Pirellulaceae bacterium]
MPQFIIKFVRVVDAVNYRLGRIIMYGIFLMVMVLLWSSISKTFFVPSSWTLEIAQFSLVAYYILGGPYSIQLGANVRMDLFYGNWTVRQKAWVDSFTVIFLLFYLGVLLYGALDSTTYALKYNERSPTAWRPYLWPIKVTATIGIFLMLLQALSEFFKDIAMLRGVDLRSGEPTAHLKTEND